MINLTSRWKNRKGKDTEVADLLLDYDKLFSDKNFNAKDYVELLSCKTISFEGETQDLNVCGLRNVFETTTRHLRQNYKIQNWQCTRLEFNYAKKMKMFRKKNKDLVDKNAAYVKTFYELDKSIDCVANKIMYLGNMLESIDEPKAKAIEALKLMNHFINFLRPNLQRGGMLNDHQSLYETAYIIQKLHVISQELPRGNDKFDQASQNINIKYEEIGRELIDKFLIAHEGEDLAEMQGIASILSHFEKYSQCIDTFIKQRQKSLSTTSDILTKILPSCIKDQSIITKVFINPEHIIYQYMLRIFHGKLKTYIHNELNDCKDPEMYLNKFEMLYSKTLQLSHDLMISNSSLSYLSKWTKNIFINYLNTYIEKETSWLEEKCGMLLKQYYIKKKHLKKQIQVGGIHDLCRDIQTRLSTLANIATDHSGETFLSEHLAMLIISESKKSFHRCSLLSKQQFHVSGIVYKLFDILLRYLFGEHVGYALELGLLTIPLPERNTPPEVCFFDVIRKCNVIYNIFEKQCIYIIIPLVVSTPQHTDCLQKKAKVMKELEIRIHTGLEKSLNSILGWVRYLLQSEQKQVDKRTPTLDKSTTACNSIVKSISKYVIKIKATFDGKNVQNILTELGVRLHRLVTENIQQHQYSCADAMVLICDLNEYQSCVREFQIPLLNILFETLHALCNLLVVEPNKLEQMCDAEQLASLDRTVLMNFIQLRADSKTTKKWPLCL